MGINTADTYVMPTLGSNTFEQGTNHAPTGYEIEQAVLSPEEQSNFDLGREDAIEPDRWGVPDKNRDIAPTPVVAEATREYTIAEQIYGMTEQQKVNDIRMLTPYIPDIRHISLN